MLRKGGKGGAGVRSVQVASDSSLGEQLIMREEREIRYDETWDKEIVFSLGQAL